MSKTIHKDHLPKVVEALIFVSDQPINLDAILAVLNQKDEQGREEESKDRPKGKKKEKEMREKDLAPVMEALVEKYSDDRYPFEIRKVAKGYQFFTKRAYHPFVRKASLVKNQRRLTRAAMETLAIIAYRQPATKSEIEFIRGVNCDYAVQKLLDKNLVSIIGRAEAVGRPLLYATSPYFMQYFGINGVEDLPKLKEFEEMVENHMDQFRQQGEKEGEEVTNEGTPGSEEVEETEDNSEAKTNSPPKDHDEEKEG